MVSLQGRRVANRRREGEFGEPLVGVYASFRPSVFLVSRRIKNSVVLDVVLGGSLGAHLLTWQMAQCAAEF